MNSSGIKRGLAVSAVAAMAVTGLPFLASSASAATGDSIAVVSTGPALNGGTVGAVVVLRTKNVAAGSLDVTGLGSSSAGSEDTADQTVDILSATSAADPDNPGFDLITMHIATTTSTTGAAAGFRVFEDDNAGASDTAGVLDADEARAAVSISTAGPLAAIDVSPASQSAAAGQTSGAYTVTLKDSAGRTTQLNTGEWIDVTPDDAGITPSDTQITADEIATGTDSFTASSTVGTPVKAHDILLDANTTPDVKGHATLNVTQAADITADEVDIVTGADDWNGFGDGTWGGTTKVRTDQGSIRIDFKSDDVADRNSTVTLNISSANVTFGGHATTTVTTVLDGNGVGSVTITPDAFSVQVGDSITVGGSFSQTLSFERAKATNVVAEQDPYFGKLKGSVDVTVTVTDQFGAPITTGFVGAQRVAGPNTPDPQQAKPISATGTATFTFTDTKAVNGDIDTVGFGYVPDQFTPPAEAVPGMTHIKWTTDGMGADFTTKLNTLDASSSTYKASDVSVDPLADAHDNGGGDDASLEVTGGEPNAKVTVSVDGGAMILEPGETELSQASSSVTSTLSGAGALVGDYELIGTTSGVPTVTVTAAGRTETSQFTVAPESDFTTARNVSLSGPAEVPNGTALVTYTAVVTDAFGNPIAGFPRTAFGDDLLNVTVSGPGHYQDGGTQTDTNGEIDFNVALNSDAVGDVTVTVQGLPNAVLFGTIDQFGAAADQLAINEPANSAKGLTKSADVASATTAVAAPVPPAPVNINMQLSDSNSKQGKKDKIDVNADSVASGLVATVMKGNKVLASHTLNDQGDWLFKVKDGNGNKKKTTYTVTVAASPATNAASKSIKLK